MPETVLHVVDCLNVGGSERQLFELVRRLDRRRFRPLVACFKGGGELEPALRAMGIVPHVFSLKGSLTQPNTALQVVRMALLCRREDVRVVHAHDFYSNVIGVSAAQLARIPAIASRRDLAHWLSPGKRRVLRLSLHLATRVLANAEAVGEQARSAFGVAPHKLCVVPNGIDVPRFDAASARDPDPPLPARTPDTARIVMVASMHLPDKGHADLLQAATRLRARGISAQWFLVSDGRLRPELEAIAHGLLEGVCFLGRRADVAAILVRADLVVHPSWAEGFPNAVLEGMCAARPVIATRVGGIPEVLRHGIDGLLIAPQAPCALADAIAELLADPVRARAMGERGRRRVEECFSLERMCAAIERIYQSLLSRPALRFAAA